MEDRQRVVAPAALGRRLVHLERVLEVEQLLGAAAVVDEPVERGQEHRAPFEATLEQRRVDAPLALHTRDDRRLAHLADVPRLHGHLRRLRPRDTERREPPLVLRPLGRLDGRNDDIGRVDALRQVPHALTPDAPGDRDLSAHHQVLEHLRDVAVVRPTGRRPGDAARVGDVARGQRPSRPQQLQDVAPERIVVPEPHTLLLVGRPLGRPGEVEPDVAHRPDQSVLLEQGALILERPLQVVGPIGGAEPAPGDEVGARRYRCGRVELEQRQPPHDLEQIRRPRRVEQLRAHSDPAGLLLGQPVHGLEASRSASPSTRR